MIYVYTLMCLNVKEEPGVLVIVTARWWGGAEPSLDVNARVTMCTSNYHNKIYYFKKIRKGKSSFHVINTYINRSLEVSNYI